MPGLQDVAVWVGLDVDKEHHFADVLDSDGESLSARPRAATKPTAAALTEAAGARQGWVAIDQPGSLGQLAIALAGSGRCRWHMCRSW